MSTSRDIIKFTATLIVGFGTGKIVHDIVENNTTQDKITDKVTVPAASLVLGSMVADVSRRYTDVKIDRALDWMNEHFNTKF